MTQHRDTVANTTAYDESRQSHKAKREMRWDCHHHGLPMVAAIACGRPHGLPMVAAIACGRPHGLLVAAPSTSTCLLPLQRFDS